MFIFIVKSFPYASAQIIDFILRPVQAMLRFQCAAFARISLEGPDVTPQIYAIGLTAGSRAVEVILTKLIFKSGTIRQALDSLLAGLLMLILQVHFLLNRHGDSLASAENHDSYEQASTPSSSRQVVDGPL